MKSNLTELIKNQTHCACGALFPVIPGHPSQSGCGSGYAVTGDNRKICYLCADKEQVADLKDRSKPFVGYLNGMTVTTWTGGKLMTVTASRPCRLTRVSYTHDRRTYRSVHCVDVHGGHWTGRGSDGIAIKLRAVKG